jgi:hypothetical protein
MPDSIIEIIELPIIKNHIKKLIGDFKNFKNIREALEKFLPEE